SSMSGDGVRPGGTCTIKINGIPCGDIFYREILEALISVRQHLQKIHDLPVQIWRQEELDKLIGRKIKYRNQPATIVAYYPEQAAVILSPDGQEAFLRADFESDPDDYEPESRIKEDIFSPHIWWWRD